MFIGLNAITMILFMPETQYCGERPNNSMQAGMPREEKDQTASAQIREYAREHRTIMEATSVAPPKENTAVSCSSSGKATRMRT